MPLLELLTETKIKIWEKQPGGFFESRNNGLVVNGGAMFPHNPRVIIIHPLYAANQTNQRPVLRSRDPY